MRIIAFERPLIRTWRSRCVKGFDRLETMKGAGLRAASDMLAAIPAFSPVETVFYSPSEAFLEAEGKRSN